MTGLPLFVSVSAPLADSVAVSVALDDSGADERILEPSPCPVPMIGGGTVAEPLVAIENTVRVTDGWFRSWAV